MSFWKRRRTTGSLEAGAVLVRGGRKLLFEPNERIGRRRRLRRVWEPRGLGRVIAGPLAGLQPTFAYTGHNRGDFHRWLRDNIPIVSAGVWAWVRLCATAATAQIEGSAAERARAAALVDALDRRVLESPYGRGSGFSKLTDAYFLELFTTGRFAGEAVLAKDGRSVDHFRFIDPYRVGWEHTERGWTPYVSGKGDAADGDAKPPRHNKVGDRNVAPPQTRNDDEREQLDISTFFYGTLGSDITNPAGVEPLATIPFVAEIEQLMLEDMARSSHNAGTPRLQVKVGRPERLAWEDDQGYYDRANRYFESLATQFADLEPDDNIFTWNDVEVAVVGGSGKQWEWRLNRDQVVEDVITGLKLFPWVLGRTHKTTQNWVQSQFDLLMQMVEAHQKAGADLIDWLCNLELELQGVEAVVRHRFASHSDPFRLERAQAERMEIESADLMVRRGYITKDDGARRLGLVKAVKADEESEQVRK